MNIIPRITAAWRRARLNIAEQDLAWMETVGTRRLTEHRARVAELRRQVVRDSARISAADVVRRAERQIKRGLLGGAQ